MPDFSKFDQEAFDDDRQYQGYEIKRTGKSRWFLKTLGFFMILGILGYALFNYADSFWIKVADLYFSGRISTASAAGIKPGERHRLNIMLVGVDQRKKEAARADTIMVAMLNLQQKTVQVISIPRDTRVRIEGLEHQTKINHAHASGGIELTRQTVEQVLGIPIHYYIETNFQGFANVIDILGGVDLDVEKRMYYPAEDINLKKGYQHLDGHQALAYVRFRSDGKGDLPRIGRQHKFLTALTGQVLQVKTLLTLPNLASQLHRNIDTDLTVTDMAVLASEFKDVDPQSVGFCNLPGAPKYINGASYYIINEEKLQNIMDDVFSGELPANGS